MKYFSHALVFVMTFGSASSFAHHPAADIVDADIYDMIDANVADTPHADLTFDDMGSDASGSSDTMGTARTTVDTDLRSGARSLTITRPAASFSRMSGGRR